MTYEIKPIADDAVTLTQFSGDLMRIISIEVEPGKFAQVPVMRRDDAQRIVRALKLADAVTASVLCATEFDGGVVRAVDGAQRRRVL